MSIVNYGFLPGVSSTSSTGEKMPDEVSKALEGDAEDKNKNKITDEDIKEYNEPQNETLDPDDLITDETTYQLRGAVFGTKQGERKSIIDRAGEYPDYEEHTEKEKPKLSLDIDKDTLHKSTLLIFQSYSKEAYMSDEDYKNHIKIKPYLDNRDNSFLIDNNGAQARVYEYDNNIIIAFRGTETDSITGFLSDVSDDLNAKVRSIKSVWKEDYEKFNNRDIEKVEPERQGIIHQGFNNYVGRLFNSILTFISGKTDKKIYLCGHSLGAITAQITAYKLKFIYDFKVAGVYSFGAPQGLFTFEDQYDDLNLYNVIHENDLITYGMPIFYHYGNVILLLEDGEYEVYQHQELPHIPHDEETSNNYALRKNGKLQGQGELIKDVAYDEYLHTNSSYLGKSILEGIESFRSLISSLYQKLGQETVIKASNTYRIYGFTPHRRYKEHLDKLKTDIIIPQYNPDKPHHFNDIGEEHKERFEYQSSHKNHHIYKDIKKNELVLVKENKKHYKIIPLTNKNPLGLHFYKNDEDVKNKIIMFYD